MINIKAQQTLVKFSKTDAGTLLYVMRPETYSRLAESKVIQEASVRSGIQRGALKGAWDAIGEVIKAWVTEGHSVAIPGLGSLRFSMNANAVADVNDVAKSLIRSRKVVYTPSVDIKNDVFLNRSMTTLSVWTLTACRVSKTSPSKYGSGTSSSAQVSYSAPHPV